jgi:hypothetical protein
MSEFEKKKAEIEENLQVSQDNLGLAASQLERTRGVLDKHQESLEGARDNLARIARVVVAWPTEERFPPSPDTLENLNTAYELTESLADHSRHVLGSVSRIYDQAQSFEATMFANLSTSTASGAVFANLSSTIEPKTPDLTRAVEALSHPTELQARAELQGWLKRIDTTIADKYEKAYRALRGGQLMSAAHALRDAFSALLHKLAPDDEVKQQRWFKQDPNAPGVTQKQRIRYSICGTGDSEIPLQDLKLIESTEDVGRAVYQKLSGEAHRRDGEAETSQVTNYFAITESVLGDIRRFRELYFRAGLYKDSD